MFNQCLHWRSSLLLLKLKITLQYFSIYMLLLLLGSNIHFYYSCLFITSKTLLTIWKITCLDFWGVCLLRLFCDLWHFFLFFSIKNYLLLFESENSDSHSHILIVLSNAKNSIIFSESYKYIMCIIIIIIFEASSKRFEIQLTLPAQVIWLWKS